MLTDLKLKYTFNTSAQVSDADQVAQVFWDTGVLR